MSTYISDMDLSTNKNGRYVTTLTLLYHETFSNQSEQQSYLRQLVAVSALEDEEDAIMLNDNEFEIKGHMLTRFIDRFNIDLKLMNDESIVDDNIYLVEFDY